MKGDARLVAKARKYANNGMFVERTENGRRPGYCLYNDWTFVFFRPAGTGNSVQGGRAGRWIYGGRFKYGQESCDAAGRSAVQSAWCSYLWIKKVDRGRVRPGPMLCASLP